MNIAYLISNRYPQLNIWNISYITKYVGNKMSWPNSLTNKGQREKNVTSFFFLAFFTPSKNEWNKVDFNFNWRMWWRKVIANANVKRRKLLKRKRDWIKDETLVTKNFWRRDNPKAYQYRTSSELPLGPFATRTAAASSLSSFISR